MKETNLTSRRGFLRSSLCLAGAASLGVAVIGKASAASRHKMLFAHTFTSASEQYVVTGIDLFKELAEKYSDGALLVDVHEGGKLGGQTELPQKVQYGAVQACHVSMQNFTPYAEVYNLLDLPYLFPSTSVFNRFLSSKEFEASRFGTDPLKKGLKILPGMWTNTGFRVLCTSKRSNRPIRLLSDLKGIKLRVTNSKVEQQTFSLTPASPVSVNWAETYQAMQQGAVDALNVGLGPLTANRIHEVVGHASRTKLSFNAHVAMVSRKWYEKLPEAVQHAIDRAAAECWEYQKREQDKADERMWKDWEAAGIQVTDLTEDEHAQWVDAIGHQRSEWDSWKNRYGVDLYEQILAYVKQSAV
ncbi:TRAP transporter substrate-binding protein [Allopusillimonas soli]|uniref:TRAP transporter substrate-binding protein n=1 Tax=Allopusillimonas soli TaxID=659016 RepID=A0A853F913_9BURK|nr:TRAP transporter substrate-binding protein [Allopusillimonas soli]NYT36082.1 TRAP transporter substrate-binding protein [Allopusillimonas soli]TEA76419.1 TRAP transporter substrate-binding protein [Allopusillimonas soli]